MLKIQEIKSNHSSIPLGQIRTDGNQLEWIVDNYNLQAQFQTYSELKAYVDSSSTMSLVDFAGEVPTLRNFSLSTGDTLTVTSDGKTALINGKLISQAQKDQLQDMIDSGKIKVMGEGAQLPVMKEKKPAIQKRKLDFTQLSNSMRQKESEKAKKGSVHHDPEIEEAYGDSYENALAKNLSYLNKYGKLKGGKEVGV